SATQVDDSFDLSTGSPQWIFNDKENVRILCAHNGSARLYQLSGAYPGAVPTQLPGIIIRNVATDTSTQPVSTSKMVSTKDNILYFGLNKTDKTGVYALGQLDADKPVALTLSKRFHTSDYAKHTAIALYIQGPNFYGAFDDNGTHSH